MGYLDSIITLNCLSNLKPNYSIEDIKMSCAAFERVDKRRNYNFKRAVDIHKKIH